MDLFRFIYTSQGVQIQKKDLDYILGVATVYNKQNDISGILLFGDNTFVQVLEGPLKNVKELAERIKADPRHEGFQVILEDHIESRLFGDWAMACSVLTDSNLHSISDEYRITTTGEFMQFIKDPKHYLGDYLAGLFIHLVENEGPTTR